MRCLALLALVSFGLQAQGLPSIGGAGMVHALSGTPPTFVSGAFTATDGSGTAFNTSTIAVNITGTNTLLIACWEAEFPTVSYLWTYKFNGIWGNLFYQTDGYAGGAGNKLFPCAYWTAPAAGTHNLVITLEEGTPGTPANIPQELVVTAILFNGASQTFWPFRDTQKDISASVRTTETETVTSSTSDLVVHVMASSLAVAGTPGAGETTRIDANSGGNTASLLVTTKAGAASVVVSSSGWANSFPLEGLAFSILPAGAAETYTLFSDDFNRADENPLSKSGAWGAPAGATVGAVELVGNQAKGNSAILENIAQVASPSFPNNQRAQLTYTGSFYTRLWVRSSNAGGYMLNTNGAGIIELYAVANNGVALSYTNINSSAPFRNLVAGDFLELEASGTTLNMYFNGQFYATFTDATFATGQPGLGAYTNLTIAQSPPPYTATSLPARN